MEASYKVIYTGEIQDGFNFIKVEQSFAQLFKINPEKSSSYLVPNKVIKKDLTLERANTYKQKLEAIGMIMLVENEQPALSAMDMSLAPMEEDPASEIFKKNKPKKDYEADNFATSFDNLAVVGLEDQFSPSTPMDQSPHLNAGQIECPKCSLVQDKAEICSGCGVYIEKVLKQKEYETAQEEKLPYQQYIKPEDLEVKEEVEEKAGFPVMSIIGALAVTLLGAWAWKLIAINVNYEIAWVAVIIGSAIAITASFFNHQGRDLSIVCALLAALSIYGGKYLTVEADKLFAIEEANEGLSYIPDEILMEFYEQFQNEAPEFMAIINDKEAFKELIVMGAYSEGYDPDTIPIDEIYDYLYVNVKPYVDDLLINQTNFYTWKSEMPDFIATLIHGFPTTAIIKYEFEWVDWLFLFLGVSAAFQISRKQFI